VRGRDVTRVRESLGMTMREFGDLIKVSEPAISRWESGSRPVSASMAELIRLKVAEHLAEEPAPTA